MTNKEKLFCKEYILDFNGRRAAEKAGYSKKTARSIACTLLTNVDVKNEVNKLINARLEKLSVTGEQIIHELTKIAFSDIKDFTDENGSINLAQVNESISSVIAEVTISDVKGTKNGEDFQEESIKKIKLHDKMKAIELLGKHLAMFTDVSKTIPADDYSELKEKEIDEKIKNALNECQKIESKKK